MDVYRPAPASFAVFDINAIQEPWLTADNDKSQENQEKPTHVPASVLEKLNKFENDAPHSWDEVSKALEDLKPAIPTPPINNAVSAMQKLTPLRKRVSFHTLEEFDEKISSKQENKELKNIQSMRTEETNKKKPEPNKSDSEPRVEVGLGGGGHKPVKENIFIIKDRREREKEGKQVIFEKLRRDPLSDFPEKCPPGGADSVVVYTTSLRGVRRTFEDCARVLNIFEVHRVVTDERDVSLHGEFLKELRELVGEEEASLLPRVFVKGRYVGGWEELNELNESGKLGRIVRGGRLETGIGRQGCGGCGGARFVPCLDCGGSCKVLVDGVKERCGKCNENGLVHCPACA